MASIVQITAEMRQRLAAAGVASPEAETRILLRELAGVVHPALADPELEPAPEVASRLAEALRRRLNREPLQYILGTAPFRDLELEVTPNVLIPRPETELLVDWVLDHLPSGGRLLDVGTGSGAIALAAAQERPDAQVTGVDLSSAALAVAERNRRKYALKNVRLLKSDLDTAVAGERFDVVAANLPYVTEAEYPTLEPEVRDHEPKLALTAPEDGMALMRRLARRLPELLTPCGGAIFELAPPQAAPMAEDLRRLGFTASVLKDYARRERFVTAVRP